MHFTLRFSAVVYFIDEPLYLSTVAVYTLPLESYR